MASITHCGFCVVAYSFGEAFLKEGDEVILVGGSSRIPAVQQLVEDFFPILGGDILRIGWDHEEEQSVALQKGVA